VKQITTIFILVLGYCHLFGQADFEQKDRERIAKNKVKNTNPMVL
jgi:hypothetical protein